MFEFHLGLFFLAIAFGIWVYLDYGRTKPRIPAERSGWVYFLSPVNGDEADPPSPIKIGLTHRDPVVDRLPEIETMSPERLALIYSYRTDTPQLDEARIHQELGFCRLHGEWFQRYPVLMYIDELKKGTT